MISITYVFNIKKDKMIKMIKMIRSFLLLKTGNGCSIFIPARPSLP